MNCCFGRLKLSFTTLLKIHLPNCFNFSAESPKLFWKHSFFKKLLKTPLDIWKTLLTFLEKLFVRIPKKFWPNFLKFFTGSFERTNLFYYFWRKDYFWRKEKLLKSLLKRTHEKPNFHHSIKENVENKILFENDFLKMFLLDTKTAVLRDLPKTSAKYPIFISFIVPKRENSLFGEAFPQTFLWRHREHFCQRCKKHNKRQKLFAENINYFRKMSQKDEWWNFTKNTALTKKLHRARKRQFW